VKNKLTAFSYGLLLDALLLCLLRLHLSPKLLPSVQISSFTQRNLSIELNPLKGNGWIVASC
jgi:hypothetical protein